MTVIRLDAAILAKVQAGTGVLFLGNEAGMPIWKCDVTPVEHDLDREPQLTEAQWREIENDPVESTLEEVWAKVIPRGEAM